MKVAVVNAAPPFIVAAWTGGPECYRIASVTEPREGLPADCLAV